VLLLCAAQVLLWSLAFGLTYSAPELDGAEQFVWSFSLESGRVVVLTASPATVKTARSIDLPRPRVMSEIRYGSAFIEIARRIWDDLRDEVTLGQRSALGLPSPASTLRAA